jgi:hypothetical protein
MSPALPALLTNIAIVGCIVATAWITKNPLALFALLLLKELPIVVPHAGSVSVVGQGDEDDEEEGGRPMGFIH